MATIIVTIRTQGASASRWFGSGPIEEEVRKCGPFTSINEARDFLKERGWDHDSIYGMETKISHTVKEDGVTLKWSTALIEVVRDPSRFLL